MNIKKIITGSVAAAGIIAGGLAGAGYASADESSYLRDLEQSGYGFEGPKSVWLQLGYGICDGLGSGVPWDQVVGTVIAVTGENIYVDQATFIVEAADIHLC